MLKFADGYRPLILAIALGLTICLMWSSCKVKKPVVPVKVPEHAMTPKVKELIRLSPVEVPEPILPEKAANPTLKKVLLSKKIWDDPSDCLIRYYESENYKTILTDRYLASGELEVLLKHLDDSPRHGLNPEAFHLSRIRDLFHKMVEMKPEKMKSDLRTKAELEALLSAALIKYSLTMRYGMVNPDSIYVNYFISGSGPDSAAMMEPFSKPSLGNYLDSIQPASASYLAMQKALETGMSTKQISAEEAELIIKVNLERLRWKNKPLATKYVWVNIPDFNLDVIEKGKSVLQMKVCVGEGRNKSYQQQLSKDPDTGLVTDQLQQKESPQLNSIIHSVQVNPIWNIPASIARAEISKYQAEDPDYLENNEIDVYRDGKRISSSQEIDWEQVDHYSFKQRPGDQNSLGKIKFLFNNHSSVYLHDTPVKSAFKKANRAISHGCIRVEKPLELALALFGKGKTYDQIRLAMQNSYPRAKNIALPQKIPVYLSYYTAWADHKGVLQLRRDVYGLDMVLYSYMKKHQMISMPNKTSANK